MGREAGVSERQLSPKQGKVFPAADWPVGRFLDLLRVWIDFDLEEPLSARSLKPQVEALNTLLGLAEGSPAAFIHTMDGVPATPVPFIFQGNQAGVAVLGLNPQDRGTVEEKRMTGKLPPPAYARYYTSERCLPQAVSGPYYRNLGTVLLSLETGRLVKFSDYLRRYPDRASAFAAIAAGRGVLEMRLIPFYSRAWRPAGTRGLARLLAHPRYGRYYEKMAAMLEDVLEPDGWIIANGRDPAELLPQLLAARAPLTGAGPADMAAPYAFYRWQGRRVILLRQFLRSRGGRLNTNRDLARLFADVSRAFRP